MKISVKFFHHPDIEIQVDDTETGRLYFDLTQEQNRQQKPFYKDTRVYTPEYMISLAHRAREAFGWSWFSDSYDTSITAQLHKDLENSVGKLGFDQIPQEYDDLLYDLHHCLHAIQHGKVNPERQDNFQIEWLTDVSLPLPASFEFKETSNFGDLILINPYVGHNPLQVYRENDFAQLETTCRFHDKIKPGIVISPGVAVTKDAIVGKFKQMDPEFVAQHSEEKIRYYAGVSVIGRVTDVDLFRTIRQSPEPLVLDSLEFYE